MKKVKFLAEFGQPDLFANRSTVGFEITAMLLPVSNAFGGATNRSLRPRERRLRRSDFACRVFTTRLMLEGLSVITLRYGDILKQMDLTHVVHQANLYHTSAPGSRPRSGGCGLERPEPTY